MQDAARFPPGTLWSTIVERTRTALARGALRPIATEAYTVEDAGVKFEVRTVSSLARKRLADERQRQAKERDGTSINPFLPYEVDLFVADISESHICLLNKYNVIDHHVLIITRAFKPQESPLVLDDFAALWRAMAEFDALGFYNSSPIAGASQPHRHLQLIPLTRESGERIQLPIQPLLSRVPERPGIQQIDRLPFRHAYARLDPALAANPDWAAQHLYGLYRAMLAEMGVVEGPALPAVLPPYNLLATRDFMLLVPRVQGAFQGVPVNALGFAGSFFVFDLQALEVIRTVGPMSLLQQVAIAR